MDKYGYNGPERFRPLSPWAYFGYTLLFAIPIIGFICLIIFSLSDTNINRRSFARSFFCGLVIALIADKTNFHIAFAFAALMALIGGILAFFVKKDVNYSGDEPELPPQAPEAAE